MSKFYAGIGSRETPPDILDLMTRIATKLEQHDWVLRSGGAVGADSAFERGCTKKEIFLPWGGGFTIPQEAYIIAEGIHPAWKYIKPGVKTLMARNDQQILGPNLDSPSKMVICWTKDGIESEQQRTRKSGGTGQAIAQASRLGIPVYNLCLDNRRNAFENFLVK